MTPEQFKNAREHLRLSQSAMARLLGVKNDRTIRRWEEPGGEVPPYVSIIVGYWENDSLAGRWPRQSITAVGVAGRARD